MKRFLCLTAGLCLAAGLPVVAQAGEKEQARSGAKLRGIIRAGVDEKGRVHGDLKKLAPEFANATSLNYKILLLKDGKNEYVDPDKTTFKFGQKFRLEIEADTDLYIYVFHEGPDGVRRVLLPDAADQGDVPMVKKGNTQIVPDDGTFFEFVPPAGTEKLMVYATKEKRADLTEEAIKAGAEGKVDIKLKNKQDQVFSAAKPKKKVDVKQVAETDQGMKFSFRGIGEGITFSEQGAKTVIKATKEDEKPSVYVEISLTSEKS